ncbi:TPA: site-specific integrase [Bacillus mycoides]|uniref:site-specific integrase n=1 Tax=Bacillus sp. FSL P2-0099 TaxID=2921572 RepID=UPI0030F82F9F|nr:site-specific integrase [Bacillus mycoides]
MEYVQPIRNRKQIDAMKKILKATNLRDYCLFNVGINSGLRISDLLQLRIRDVIDEKHNIMDRISLREVKTGKTKDFPIGDTSKKAIKEYLMTRNYEENEPLFRSRKGKEALKRQQAYRIINEAARAIGIKERIGTHTLRKTFGYHAYQSGVDLSILQKLFNHSAPSVTLAYIGMTQDDLDNVYLNLNL